MNPPLVSIIIPCHNAAPWLAASLDSVFAQTWDRKEIILVNDGSSDSSLEIARTYESAGLKIFSQEKKGQCAACNRGLLEAKGDYIKFFDADDILSSGMIELQARALVKNPDHLAYGEWARFHSFPEEARFAARPEWRTRAPVDWLQTAWADGEPMMQCALYLIPRHILDKTGGWDERLSLINDLEFFTRLTLASEGIVFTPEARLYYRSGLPGSLSDSRNRSAWESAYLSSTTAAENLIRHDQSENSRHAAAAVLQEIAFGMYPNSPDLVKKLERKAQSLSPTVRRPRGGNFFQMTSRLLGWKASRWLQIFAGKHPRPGKP